MVEFRWSVYICGEGSASTSAMTSPSCSPCKMDALRWVVRITSVTGPVTAAVTDLESLIELEAGIMEPSDAHMLLSWADEDGVNLQVEARA